MIAIITTVFDTVIAIAMQGQSNVGFCCRKNVFFLR